MSQSFEYQFDWDPAKARMNYRKHGISFERATAIFEDPQALSIFDQEHSSSEDRWITLGLDASGIPLVIVHTFQLEGGNKAHVRIISARKAARKEVQHYKEA